MALILNFEICQNSNCKDLVFSETTGNYNVTYNPTGYSTPNISITDVLTATLTMTSPSGVVTTVDLFPLGFPTNNLIIDGYTITSNSALADGQWTFVYTITTDSETYTKTVYKMFTCNSECCVKTMQPVLDTCDCCNQTTDTTNYITAWTFLQSLKAAATCGDTTSFNNILKIITKLCLNSGCKTCK